jgi:acetyl esterase/lipase
MTEHSQSEAMRQMVERVRQSASERRASGPVDIETSRRTADAMAPRTPDDVRVLPVEADGVPADWLLAPGADPERRLLYLHGGGYTTASRRSHRRLASDISRAGGCAVLIIDYRLAPEHAFPAALDDAVTAFRWMRGTGPDDASEAATTFAAGDSAGGGLALALLLALRDAGEPLPAAAVTLSAWTDLALTGDSLQTRAGADPMIRRESLAEWVRAYAPGEDPRNPLLSPLYGDLAGLPPLLMQVADNELMLDDTLRVAERARAAGVDVTCEVEPGGFHVYQSVAGLLPEAQAAVDRIGAFLRRHAA